MMKGKSLLKIGIVIVMFTLISFSDWTFAADNDMEILKVVSYMLHIIVCILSWFWIFFARGAGELLTNKWVYGEMLGLDALLWQYRNIIKNIANFGLGFYFVYLIFSSLLDKSDIIGKIKNKILYLLIAGIGIQASWFFTAVIVDVSTVTLVAAGAFPAQIVSQNETVTNSIEYTMDNFLKPFNESLDSLNRGLNFSLFSSDMGASNFITVKSNIELDKPMTRETFFDKLMPNQDSVSGPLYYLGFAILKTTYVISPNSSDLSGWMSTIFNTLIQGGTTIIYSIEMLVLFIFAAMRVIYMWMFIILSPLVILLRCMKKSGEKGWDWIKGFNEHINFTSFFWNAFKPTLIVLGFSLAMIFASLMGAIIASNQNDSKSFDMKGMKVYEYKEDLDNSSNPGNQKYTTVMDGETINLSLRNAGKTILDFVLSILTVFLVYIIISVFVNMGGGKDFVSKKIKKVQGFAERGLTSLPVMPVSGYDKNGKPTTHYLGVGKLLGIGKGNETLFATKIKEYQGEQDEKYNEQQAVISSWFGNETGYLTADEVRKIENAGTTGNRGLDILTAKKNAIEKSEDGKGMTLDRNTSKNDRFWIRQFGGWLTSMQGKSVSGENSQIWNKMITRWNSEETKKIEEKMKMQTLFTDVSDAVRAYAEFFGLKLSVYDWEHLKDADISKK